MLLAILAVSGAQLLRSARCQESKPAPFTVRRADIQRDLELVARVEGTAPLYRWWPISITVDLVNRSPSASYPVVMPGDGSDADMREPYVYFTTDVLTEDGSWNLLQHGGGARCGNYDPYWLDEVVVLAPGASRRLQWIDAPFLPESGRARVRAHYTYAARPAERRWGDSDRTPLPDGLGGMKGVEPFELVSAPVELTLQAPEHTRAEIERDLALELTREGSPTVFSWQPLRFRMKLVNRSKLDAYRVVRPSFTRDPWQHEPRVREYVQIDRGDGTWREAEKRMGGFYDGPIDEYETRPPQPDWRPQIVDLTPGQSIEFELPASRVLYQFRDARAARMSVSYDYLAFPVRGADGAPMSAPESLGDMAAVPPFGLRSNEIAWGVRSPLEIEILPRADRDPSRSSRLADHVRIVLRNVGDEAVEISSVQTPARLDISALGVIVAEGPTEVFGTLVLPPLEIPPHGEISFLEDPRIDVRTIGPLVPFAGPKPAWLRAEVQVLLHRAGWIDIQSARWKPAVR